MVVRIDGGRGQLVERLLELVDDPAPQIRAVVTTLLIKALDEDGSSLIHLMVSSDPAAMLIDPRAALQARTELFEALRQALGELAARHGEVQVVRTWRDYLLGQMERWAKSAVDDADNRRRAERFLLWADNPAALAAAQRRGVLQGFSAEDLRELARTRTDEPVSPETATDLWSKRESWRRRTEALLVDEVLDAWEAGAAS